MDLPFDVVELGPADHPERGDVAPDFTRPLVTDEDWGDATLDDVVAADDDPTLLLFYPMDGSFPATYIWQEVRDRGWADHATVVGCSVSTPYAHAELIETLGLGEYRLFADPGADVAEEYGIGHDLDGMAGVTEARPAAFVLDNERVVQHAWVATEWPDFPDYDAVESVLA